MPPRRQRSYGGAVDDEGELARLYGPWRGRTPGDAAQLLTGYAGLWWVAGGWAIEAATGQPRVHGDLDLGVPRAEVPLLQRHLAGRLDVWAADHGTLRPLVASLGREVPGTCGNLWLRASGAEPWEYDVLLTPLVGGEWAYERDPRVHRPVEEVLVAVDGVRVLRPEVQLLHKAAHRRPKDDADFAACLPLLDADARRWLADALRTAHPGHQWIDRLRAA